MESTRIAGLDDLAVLHDLEDQARASIAEQRGGAVHLRRNPPHGATWESIVEDPTWFALLGTIDQVPIGYVLARRDLLDDGTWIATVTDLFVDPEARGVGVGACLLDAVIAWAGSAGCTGVDGTALPGDRATKNFFESYGMVARAITTHLPIDRTDP